MAKKSLADMTSEELQELVEKKKRIEAIESQIEAIRKQAEEQIVPLQEELEQYRKDLGIETPGKKGAPRRRKTSGTSLIALVADVLRKANGPMHLDDIVAELGKDERYTTKSKDPKAALSAALYNKEKREQYGIRKLEQGTFEIG